MVIFAYKAGNSEGDEMSRLQSLIKILKRDGFNREAYLVRKIDMLQKYSVSKQEAERAKKWFSENSHLLSFDELFDEKTRIIVPFSTKEQMELIEIVTFLKEGAWSPSGGGNYFNVKKKKQKLKKLETGEEYEKSIEVADLKLSREESVIIPSGPRKGEHVIRTITSSISKILLNPKYKAPKWMSTWWQKNQTEYASNYNWKQLESVFKDGKLTTEHSVIISRDPLDVLRMSDHAGIRSCHSEGDSYFNCAISESKGNGLVAYLVETKEIDKLLTKHDPWGWDPDTGKGPEKKDIGEFDGEEIFADRDRGVLGVKAKSRVRLRKYAYFDSDSGDHYEFAVPEHRTYGPHPPGFKKLVTAWAWKNQKDLFTSEDGSVSLPEIYDLEMHGGSYRDTSDGEILNAFFKEGGIDSEFRGNAETSTEDSESVLEMWINEINEINELADAELEHISMHAEAELSDEGNYPYVYSSAYLECEIPLYGWGEVSLNEKYAESDNDFNPIPISWRSEGYSLFRDLIEHDEGGQIEELYVRNNSLHFHITFSCDDCANPDDVFAFYNYVKSDIEGNYDEYIEKVRRQLIEEGYIGEIEFDHVSKRLISSNFKNFDVSGGDYGKILVTSKKDLIPLNLIVPTSVANSENHQPYSVFNMRKHGRSRTGYLLIDEPKIIINILNDMARESYEFAKKQLHFEFYKDNTTLSDFSNVISNLKIKVSFHENELYNLRLEVSLKVQDSEDQILSLEKFVKELDENFSRIIWPVIESLSRKLSILIKDIESSTESFYGGSLVMPIIQKLKSSNQPDVKRLALWIERNWNNFNNAEKEVAYHSYLLPTERDGDYIHNDGLNAPRFWDSTMQRRPDTDVGYHWSGLSIKDVMPYTDLNAPIGAEPTELPQPIEDDEESSVF